jgi:hypothetical protein
MVLPAVLANCATVCVQSLEIIVEVPPVVKPTLRRPRWHTVHHAVLVDSRRTDSSPCVRGHWSSG